MSQVQATEKLLQPIKNVFLVSIDKEADSKLVLSNGLELYIDKEFGEQTNTVDQNHELYAYYRELEKEYSILYEKWVDASKKGLPVVDLKRRLMQIEAEQKKSVTNKIIKPYSNAIQWGIVEQVPLKVDARVRKSDNTGAVYYEGYFNDIDIKVGDKVYVHHFVSQDDMQVVSSGRTLYKADYNHIICVVRGEEIFPTEKWILASPIMESEEDTYVNVGDVKIYTKMKTEKKYLMSKVEAVSNQAKKAGYDPGQTIIHPTFSEYAIKVEGKDMFRMHIDDVYAVLKD